MKYELKIFTDVESKDEYYLEIENE